MRVNNQLLDRTLSFWGYANALHPINQQLVEQDRQKKMLYAQGEDTWGYTTPTPNQITVTASGRISINRDI